MKEPDAIAPLQTFEAAGRVMYVDADTFQDKQLFELLSPMEGSPDAPGSDVKLASTAAAEAAAPGLVGAAQGGVKARQQHADSNAAKVEERSSADTELLAGQDVSSVQAAHVDPPKAGPASN